MNVYAINSDVTITMTPEEACELAKVLQIEQHPLAARLRAAVVRGVAQRWRVKEMWRASNQPIQDLPAHSAERDQRDISER